mgnify:CR=1 FL=1|tara:strand:+ start:190 stop:426 length:237 start_codon:yes stop_codon:yes gene_type:complete
MLGNSWYSSSSASKKLGVKEAELSELREYGLLKPGIHWRSAPLGQNRPWNPEAIYNVELCREMIGNQNRFKNFRQYAA